MPTCLYTPSLKHSMHPSRLEDRDVGEVGSINVSLRFSLQWYVASTQNDGPRLHGVGVCLVYTFNKYDKGFKVSKSILNLLSYLGPL